MFLLYAGVLTLGVAAFFYIRSKRREAANRYAVAFTQWEAEWNGNGVHEYEDTYTVNTAIEAADQSAT